MKAEQVKKVNNEVDRRKIYSTDPVALVPLTPNMSCTRIGLGTGVRAAFRRSNLTRMKRNEAVAICRFAYDHGIRLFDLADKYGTHPVVREALADKPRISYTLITKFPVPALGQVPGEPPIPARTIIERFLKELDTDYLDLIQLHKMVDSRWPEQHEFYMDELAQLKQLGLIRAHGITSHSLAATQAAARSPWVDSIQARLNTAGVHMDGTFAENASALADCHKAGQGVVMMKIYGRGAIRTPEERRRSLDAILRLCSTDVIVVGFDRIAYITELLDNVEASLKEMEAEALSGTP